MTCASIVEQWWLIALYIYSVIWAKMSLFSKCRNIPLANFNNCSVKQHIPNGHKWKLGHYAHIQWAVMVVFDGTHEYVAINMAYKNEMTLKIFLLLRTKVMNVQSHGRTDRAPCHNTSRLKTSVQKIMINVNVCVVGIKPSLWVTNLYLILR